MAYRIVRWFVKVRPYPEIYNFDRRKAFFAKILDSFQKAVIHSRSINKI
jgi:hypothetical protein